MKKIFALTLTILLILTSINASATEASDPNTTLSNKEYGYTYTHNIDSQGRITNSYSQKDNLSFSSYSRNANLIRQNDYAYTKSVLSDLGMGDSFIDALSDEALEMYAFAESITITTTYNERLFDGTVSVVSEETAKNNADRINSSRVIPLPEDFGDGEGNGNVPGSYIDTETTTYTKITLTVTRLNNGTFHYSADMEWLTEPNHRAFDSLGICVQNNTLIADSENGWFSMMITSYTLGSEDTRFYGENITSYETMYNNNWCGSGIVYRLPIDDLGYTRYTDIKTHYEFRGLVNQPTVDSFFYATATHEHQTSHLPTIYPDLEITPSGDETYISMDTIWSTDLISVRTSLPIHHVP